MFRTNEYEIMWILLKHQVWDHNIGFSITEFRFLFKFVVILQTLEFYVFFYVY